MTLIKQIITLVLVVCSSISWAQQTLENTSESIVVLSEDDIVSLVSTLRKHKKEKVVENTNLDIELDTIKKKASYNTNYLNSQFDQLNNQKTENSKIKNDGNLDLYNRSLNTLKKEISQLQDAIKQLSTSNKNIDVSALPHNDNTRIIEVPQTVYIKEVASSINKDETQTRLQHQLDSLYIAFKNIEQPTNTNYTGDFKAIQQRIDDLKKSMQDKSNVPSNYDLLARKYKGYNRAIYFEDNSKTLNLSASTIIEELFAIIDANENLDVIVKGFASNKGNAIYNENLSMQRTESVKKALMIRGVHPTRVLTQYHGIDYKAAKETEARRVEISILVRK